MPVANQISRRASGAPAMVRVDALRKFAEVVTALGGDPHALLARYWIDPAILSRPHAVVPYLSLVKLLKQAAIDLDCPDFGMRLAAVQEGAKVLGPLEVAMRHSTSLRAALAYCAAHIQVYSTSTSIALTERPDGAAFLQLLVHLPASLLNPQSVEHALLLMQHSFADLTGGRVRAREIWFTGAPVSPPTTYEAYFGSPVRFGQKANGALLTSADLDCPVPGADTQLLELATYFIEVHYPPDDDDLSARAGALVEQLLEEGRCTPDDVAAMLGMGARTFQRRLKAEGKSFEDIRNAVRRDIALRYLQHSDLPLIRVAELLGYSDASVLTRSCHRWFGASPRQLRQCKLADSADGPSPGRSILSA
jgi:AraC-like DNA-binding protein